MGKDTNGSAPVPWLLTSKQLQELLGLSKPTVAKLLARDAFGEGAVLRVGRSVRVRSDMVRRWIEAQGAAGGAA